MADQGLGSPNMDESMKKEIQSKGGRASRSGGNSSSASRAGGSSTSGRGSKEGQIKGGKNSHDNQYTV
jgi:hypothetical protein